MILVTKPAAAPARLAAGAALTRASCKAVEVDPQPYLLGQQKFHFESSIYGHSSVKKILEHAQNKKCCYCEGHFSGHAPGDIEHYRPKDGAQQALGKMAEFPGYYWLAYEWSNLYFSCPDCNRSAKRRLFPLSNPRRRARQHGDDVSAERPLILDPGGPDDPRDHIRFRQEVPFGITRRGKATVMCVKLDRGELNERRRTRLAELKCLKELSIVLRHDTRRRARALLTETNAVLAAAVRPNSIFSAMAQGLF
jgi:uncharacterized protein (TIGR02646 family)